MLQPSGACLLFSYVPPCHVHLHSIWAYFKQIRSCNWRKKKVWIIESLEEMLITSNQGPKDLVKYSLECI